MTKPKRIGIMSAMQEELDALITEMRSDQVTRHGMREYHEGALFGHSCVLVFSRWGKVAAATTATSLISEFEVDRILFTGVAGGAGQGVSVGDVVVGTSLVQHDMDARPLFKRHEIPLLGVTDFPINPEDSARVLAAARSFIKDDFFDTISMEAKAEFGIDQPKVLEGEIASGDQFFSDRRVLDELKSRLPSVLCVEMEGAAVAQVCHEYGIPFSIIRTISDSADEHAPINFQMFIREVASRYSHGIVKRLLGTRIA